MKFSTIVALITLFGTLGASDAYSCSRCGGSSSGMWPPDECYLSLDSCTAAQWTTDQCESTFYEVLPGSNPRCYCPRGDNVTPEICGHYGINCWDTDPGFGECLCECATRPCPDNCEYAFQSGNTLHMCWITIDPEDVIQAGLDFDSLGIQTVEYHSGGIFSDVPNFWGFEIPCSNPPPGHNGCPVPEAYFCQSGELYSDNLSGWDAVYKICSPGEGYVPHYSQLGPHNDHCSSTEFCSHDEAFEGLCTGNQCTPDFCQAPCFCEFPQGNLEITQIHPEYIELEPSPEMSGDPHLKSWSGQWFDYMGECDLKLMHAPKFDGKNDMDVHVRTTIRYDYSFIEAAALKIGQEILEVAGFGNYALNGVEGASEPGAANVTSLGGYPFYYTQVDEKTHKFDIVLAQKENITISTHKDWVNVKILHADKERFEAVSGLMGDFHGVMRNREGSDMHNDIDALGQDWQVHPEDGDLFRTARAPQFPAKCNLPAPQKETSRRLGETIAEQDAAEEACSNLVGKKFSMCVHDVMVSGDLDMAKILAE